MDYDSAEEDTEALVGQVMAVKPVSLPGSDGTNKRKNRTLRLIGFIESKEALILVDSGSAGTFISQEIGVQISQAKESCEPLQFTTTDGSMMLPDTFIPKMQWHVQGHTFNHDTRILPL
jgi:hypothetical protein